MEPYQQYMYSYPHKTAYRSLSGIRLEDYQERLVSTEQNSLYFHIPFCEAKCGYCNLFSLAGQPASLVDAYLDSMALQLKQYALDDVRFMDLTIGGGTPLFLSVCQLDRLFSLAEQMHYAKRQHARIIETSPRQTTADKVAILKQHGITRLSIGVQSFQDKELTALGRVHRKKDIYQALDILKAAAFPCLNIDLIYGLPGQHPQSLLDSLQQALYFQPEELFLYPLYIKPGTGLHQQRCQIDAAASEMYQLLRERLLTAGYQQTSMRRFVQQDSKESALWQGCGYGEHILSIGCGGRSYIDELHFCTPYSVSPPRIHTILDQYLQNKDHQPIVHGYLLSVEEQKRRFLLKNLFYYKGLPLARYLALFQKHPFDDFPILQQWLEANYFQTDPSGNLLPTETGLALSDYLGPQLISAEVSRKMEAWQDV